MVFLWFSYGFPILWFLVTWQLRYSMEILDSGWGQWAPWIWICSSFSSSFFPIFSRRYPYNYPFLPHSQRLVWWEDHPMTILQKKSFQYPENITGWWYTYSTKPTPLKNDGVKVSWDDDIPSWIEKQKPCSKPPARLTLNVKDEP